MTGLSEIGDDADNRKRQKDVFIQKHAEMIEKVLQHLNSAVFNGKGGCNSYLRDGFWEFTFWQWSNKFLLKVTYEETTSGESALRIVLRRSDSPFSVEQTCVSGPKEITQENLETVVTRMVASVRL